MVKSWVSQCLYSHKGWTAALVCSTLYWSTQSVSQGC